MELTIHVSDRAKELLGDNLAQKIEALVEAEALRLWYVQRSMPKARTPRQPGRPALTPEERRFKELTTTLEEIYLKRREQLGQDFHAVLGESYTILSRAIENHDLQALEQLMEVKPWIRKW